MEIKVQGMMCEGCENRIQNALSKIEGVEEVDANHKTGIVTITLSAQTDGDILKEKIEDLGFEVE